MATKKGTGMIPGADPTAPGGMSKVALATELIEKHGYSGTVKTLAAGHWPDLIDAVIQERQDREAEAKEIIAEHEADDLDVLLAEINPTRDESIARFAEGMDTPMVVQSDERPPLFIGMPGTKDYIFDGHAGCGPSASERWIHCTASLAASRAFLETLTVNQQYVFAGANEAARQGTTAHAAAEAEANMVLGRLTEEEVEQTLLELAVMPTTEGEAYDDEMGEYITEYVDLIRTYAQTRGDDHVMIEQRVSAVVPLMTVDADGDPEIHEIRGSADAIVLPTPEEPDLVVADLKYGDGIYVEVEDNSQAMIYALGVLDLLADDDGNLITPVEKITLHIVQPRLGGIRTWTLTLDELLDWRDEVLSPALTEALGGLSAGAKFNPGEKACQFCPARGGCTALAESRLEQASELFDVLTQTEFDQGPGAFPETALMSDAQLGSLYAQVTGLTDLAKALKEEVSLRLHRGQDVPGFWLVNYSPPRTWTPDASEVLADMKEVWQRKLITPTAAAKALGDGYGLVEEYVVKPDRVPMVSTGPNDRRSKWEGRPPEQMFADESGES